MKLDAHCIVDEGFDIKLMKDCKYEWTVVPRMYNLHAFDWQCKKCGKRWYQGPTPTHCMNKGEKRVKNEKCDSKEFRRVMVWQPRWNRKSDFMRFDNELKFQYWGSLGNRPESKGDIADTMSCVGACWFLHRKRYWELGGMDEEHGSWGQMGTEVACKAWLSGGALKVNKKTWFAHMFRTQGGDFSFPYPQSGNQVAHARKYSKELFKENKWKGAKRKFQWIIDKFSPIPDWPHDEADKKGIVYYTDNQLKLKIAHACQSQLKKIGLPITSVSLKPMKFGNNIHLPLKRGYPTMFKQILAGLEASKAEIVFFCEHDVLYHPSHFDFTPPKKDVFYYNTNVWRLRLPDGLAVRTDDCRQVSGLCAYRELLLKHYKERIKMVEDKLKELGDGKEFNRFIREMGFEPGTHGRIREFSHLKSERWESKYPNVDIRRGKAVTRSKWKPEDYRNKRFAKGWQESDTILGWGKGKDILHL